ncbi:MAG: type II toxin-antitoxin system YafQ family toxin [Candidatus Moraniibacteriota bacterium]|jgi:mRNA interferase YafQ|nr:MAG: type II toxin-antitoxin system YafQ family toxin [Candidatus Moranbacteria bacterium]
MREIKRTSEFKRNVKLMLKRGKSLQKLQDVVVLLVNDSELPEAYKDHPLIGNYIGFRDCHIEPDWILIYKKIDEPERVLHLEATGTHSDLF